MDQFGGSGVAEMEYPGVTGAPVVEPGSFSNGGVAMMQPGSTQESGREPVSNK